MRIGLIAPPWIAVPPPAYGGTEVVVDNLARGLRDLGHEVELFTVAESTCPVERRYLYEAAQAPIGIGSVEAAHALAAYESLSDVDIIHDHTLLGPLISHTLPQRPPVVTTNHGPFTPEAIRIYSAIADNTAIVSISHAQARTAQGIPIAAVIHHGIDLDVYSAGAGGEDYLLFVGRMSPDKGVDRALRIAHAAGMRLVIVTKMREPEERDYFERQVRPLLDDDADLPSELPLADRILLMQNAHALLNPISWPEPFGLVMAESLSTGTPVLAFPNGAAPEIVDDGVTGFLCNTEQEMIAAVEKVGTIDRAACRAAAAERFSLERMARDHERLYRRILMASPRRANTNGTLRIPSMTNDEQAKARAVQ